MTNPNENDVQDDYEFARSKYYELVEKGDEAINLMLDLARESEHPRAFEVLSNMIKQNAEVADRLMELQKKKKEVFHVSIVKGEKPPLTQNNVFVGSSTDLQRILIDKMKANLENQVVDEED
jgi:hypothetical protein